MAIAITVSKKLADTLNDIESANGLVTPQQEAILAGYSVAELLRAAIALKAVKDDLEAEMLPLKERIDQTKETIWRFDRAYNRLRETMLQKAGLEGWTAAEDPEDLASVSIVELEDRVELLGSIDDVALPFVRWVKQLDTQAVLEEYALTKTVPDGVRIVPSKHARINLRKRGKALADSLGIRAMLGRLKIEGK